MVVESTAVVVTVIASVVVTVFSVVSVVVRVPRVSVVRNAVVITVTYTNQTLISLALFKIDDEISYNVVWKGGISTH